MPLQHVPHCITSFTIIPLAKQCHGVFFYQLHSDINQSLQRHGLNEGIFAHLYAVGVGLDDLFNDVEASNVR